ncbi:MAG TPA: hypothetical protein VEI97_14620 [bacterium]|nr:hypothetical protein [bacterium]
MAYTNPWTASDVSPLTNGLIPGVLMFEDSWFPHPLLDLVGISEAVTGGTGMTANRIPDFTAAGNATENAALTPTDIPTITEIQPTLVGRGIEIVRTSEAYNTLVNRAEFDEMVRELLFRLAIDDITHLSSAAGIAGATSGATSITTDQGANATLTGLMNAIDGANSAGSGPTRGIYDDVGIRGLVDDIITNGAAFVSSNALEESVRRLVVEGAHNVDKPGDTGIVFYGCRLYRTNKTAQLYTNGGNTYGIVMRDLTRDPKVQPPLRLMGRRDPMAAWQGTPMARAGFVSMFATLGPNAEIGIGHGYDLSDAGASTAKAERLQWVVDTILANATKIRTHQYSTTLV